MGDQGAIDIGGGFLVVYILQGLLGIVCGLASSSPWMSLWPTLLDYMNRACALLLVTLLYVLFSMDGSMIETLFIYLYNVLHGYDFSPYCFDLSASSFSVEGSMIVPSSFNSFISVVGSWPLGRVKADLSDEPLRTSFLILLGVIDDLLEDFIPCLLIPSLLGWWSWRESFLG